MIWLSGLLSTQISGWVFYFHRHVFTWKMYPATLEIRSNFLSSKMGSVGNAQAAPLRYHCVSSWLPLPTLTSSTHLEKVQEWKHVCHILAPIWYLIWVFPTLFGKWFGWWLLSQVSFNFVPSLHHQDRRENKSHLLYKATDDLPCFKHKLLQK